MIGIIQSDSNFTLDAIRHIIVIRYMWLDTLSNAKRFLRIQSLRSVFFRRSINLRNRRGEASFAITNGLVDLEITK